MDVIEELLPGLEEFLTITLASENLSNFAEERRQFFIERLDIVKLPPTLPPREGRILPPELLKETEATSGIPATHSTPDFAATQREISRSFVDSNSGADDETDGAETSTDKIVKVYDDIDPNDSNKEQTDVNKQRPLSEIKSDKTSDDDSDENEENALYEIPVARQQLSPEGNSQSFGPDGSSITTTGSTEKLSDDVLDSTLVATSSIPPPLPPRRDIKFSDSGSRNSINFEDKPPELPFRPPLPKRNELYTRSDKSDRSEKSNNSDPELSADGDSTSYESFDEEVQQDPDLINKLSVQLPKKVKKRMALKKSKKLSRSRSSSQWEISVPFRKLENIDISGELYYKGKLKWNRRIVAISNGCLAMYKPDKDARPSLVIPLTGYEASVNEREGRKGFELKMVHPNADCHSFSVDFKDWAALWMEHINGCSKGQHPAKYHTHLARTFSGDVDCSANATTSGSKTDLTESNSNLSTGSEGGSEDSMRSKLKGSKVMRMGSFAFRATQFFENIGKGTKSKKKSQSSGTNFRHSGDFTGVRDGIVEEPSFSNSNSTGNLMRNKANATSDSNLFIGADNIFSLPTLASSAAHVGKYWDRADDDDDFEDITHKGYLHIFSSFNKRRWGKRWCLVRENTFECYRNDCSKQCELNFLLKPCVLRRAIAETNSERGLMIMEAGREKITVEPLSNEEMGQWVRVLLIETSTQNVPEGLEEFAKESKNVDGDSSSVLSFSVLKQWDMDCLVPAKNPYSHDYEDPVETADAAAKLLASKSSESEVAFHSDTTQNSSPIHSISKSVPIAEDVADKINDSLPVYSKNKHTTDSGFYSAKGTNSDSDSSHEAGDLDFGYAAQDSRSFYSCQHDSTLSKGNLVSSPGSVKQSCLDRDFSSTESPVNYFHSGQLEESTFQCVHLSHSSTTLSSPSSSSQKLAVSTSESQLNSIGPISNSQSSGCLVQTNDNFQIQPETLNLSKRHSNSVSAVSRSGNSESSSLTVLSPSGEEYSVVLKRSERCSRSPESSDEQNNASSASNLKSTNNIQIDNNFTDDNGVSTGPSNLYNEQTCNSANNDSDSYYEPICGLNYIASDTADNSANLADVEQSKLCSNTPQFLITYSTNEDCDQPPPIPTSPIPDFVMESPFSATSSSHTGNIETNSSVFPKQPQSVPDSKENPESSRTSQEKGRTSLNTNNNVESVLSSSLCNGENSTFGASSCYSNDVFLSCESPLTPSSEAVTAVIRNPNSTPSELKEMAELLKRKQSEIKRRRLAAHDKRQRVMNDEARLACEKEIAALERAAETTEFDIRIIQNQLEIVGGHAMETLKTTQGKNKLVSKKRKMKKKS